MKKSLKHKLLTVTTVGFVMIVQLTFADPPSPPANHGSTGNQSPPVGAPIDGGLSILLALGAGYGARKFYQAKKLGKEKEILNAQPCSE